MESKKKNKTFRWIIKILIVLLPYLIHYIRLLIQLMDEFLQMHTFNLLKFLDLLEEPEPEKKVLI